MTPLKLIETKSGKFSLLLNAGDTPVDETIASLGHEPNGYFWEGVARLLVSEKAPEIAESFSYDPEAGMFVAYGTNKDALAKLGALMAEIANDPDKARALIEKAKASGFGFDD